MRLQNFSSPSGYKRTTKLMSLIFYGAFGRPEIADLDL